MVRDKIRASSIVANCKRVVWYGFPTLRPFADISYLGIVASVAGIK